MSLRLRWNSLRIDSRSQAIYPKFRVWGCPTFTFYVLCLYYLILYLPWNSSFWGTVGVEWTQPSESFFLYCSFWHVHLVLHRIRYEKVSDLYIKHSSSNCYDLLDIGRAQHTRTRANASVARTPRRMRERNPTNVLHFNSFIFYIRLSLLTNSFWWLSRSSRSVLNNSGVGAKSEKGLLDWECSASHI